MNKLSLFFLLLINFQLSTTHCQAQDPDIEWQTCLGGTDREGSGGFIQPTSDGGYIFVGIAASTDNDVSGLHFNGGYTYEDIYDFDGNYLYTDSTWYSYSDIWVVKQDATGAIEWQKCLGGTNDEYAGNVKQTSDGGYIVAGYISSTDGDVTNNHGGWDYWVVKLNATGAIQWQKSFGSTGDDYLNSINQTSDGGYIVGGIASANDGDVSGFHGGTDYWVVKLNTAGTIQWQKCLGGYSGEFVGSVIQTTDGGYAAIGASSSNSGDVTGNHGGSDYWVVKLDTSGAIQWQKSYGGSHEETGTYIQQTNDGGYILVGYSSSNNGNVSDNHSQSPEIDTWVVKINSSGTIQWQKCLGGTQAEPGYFIQQSTDGGYIVAGSTSSNDGDVSGNHGGYDYWVVKLDTAGAIKWQKCLGGTESDFGTSIQQTTDGGYIVAGYTVSNNGEVTNNHGGSDYWVIKLSNLTDINEATLPRLALFPNPSKETITLTFDKPQSRTISIINSLGQTVLSQDTQNGQETINISGIVAGIYNVLSTSQTQTYRAVLVKN